MESYSTWQLLVRMTTTALIGGGIAGLLGAAYYAARGKPYRAGRMPGPLAVASFISVFVGALVYWFAT